MGSSRLEKYWAGTFGNKQVHTMMRAGDSRFLQTCTLADGVSIDSGGERYLDSKTKWSRPTEKTDMDDVTRLGYQNDIIPQKHILLRMTGDPEEPENQGIVLSVQMHQARLHGYTPFVFVRSIALAAWIPHMPQADTTLVIEARRDFDIFSDIVERRVVSTCHDYD